MQKRSTRHGFSSFFFQPSMVGGVADALDDTELDQLVSQQMQGPAGATLGGGAAGELDQACLGGAIELRLPRRRVLRFALQGPLQPLHHTALAYPLHRGTSDLQLAHDFLVG